ncbi:MAG: AAA family ATPase, partial [Alphaproteobacteria bacterium]|nr:AAA family ATPase [Alphaproteobacteria bacterium]
MVDKLKLTKICSPFLHVGIIGIKGQFRGSDKINLNVYESSQVERKMQYLKSFGVRHLRSFGSENENIPIKPINILVGKNSCGKSTFLRTFPLLRQSVQANTRSPILWFGDLVDFGDFETALHDGEKEITFDFQTILEIEEEQDPWKFLIERDNDGEFREKLFETQISITIKRAENNNLETKLCFGILETTIEIIYSGTDVSSVIARNTKHPHTFTIPLELITISGSLLPLELRTLKEIKSQEKTQAKRYHLHNSAVSESNKYLANFLQDFHHASKNLANIREHIENLPLCSKKKLSSRLRNAFPNDKFFHKSLMNFGDLITSVTFTLLLTKNLSSILKSADALFKDFYSGVRYQAPLRAAGERFYRYQDLQVDEVDHTGSNLPMVINSLDQSSKVALSKWILESFGFELKLIENGLHYELRIKESDDKEFHNISDMGFGYSQILPVIVSIWLELVSDVRKRRFGIQKSNGARVIVLEQPELHLHPALQYRFGLAIANV